jgi:alkaline phosphatase D
MLSRREFLRQSALSTIYLPYVLKGPKSNPTPLIEFSWSGAVTPTSARVTAKLSEDSEAVRLVVSQNEDLSLPVYSDSYQAITTLNNRVVSIIVDDLLPATRYHYALESEGKIDPVHRGKFRTFAEGPASFMIAFGSCAETGSSHPIFETIRNLDPLFFVHTGDMHYLDINTNDLSRFRQAYETVLASPSQAALYRVTPIVYTWDDHDFGPNDSDSSAPGREAARLTYQEYVPHYPLAAGAGNVPIYQAFTVGRVRFIVTDTRSERSPGSAPDNAAKTMLGEPQKAWLKQELLNGRDAYALVIWISASDWLAELSDGWRSYKTERKELADFIKNNQIKNLAMIAGDLHMLGIDNGSNSAFAGGGGGGFPVMQASPLDRFGFDANVSYSEGRVAGRGQFGIMNVIDYGGTEVAVEWSGRTWKNEEVLAYHFTVQNQIGQI